MEFSLSHSSLLRICLVFACSLFGVSEMYPVNDHKCTSNPNGPAMTLHKFHGQNAPKCMDGSFASFYLLKQDDSQDWVIYLPGGSFCADSSSCAKRMVYEPTLTSSKHLTRCMSGENFYN